MGKVRHYTTYLAGVRHKNRDGSSRQRLIRKLDVEDKVALEHEDDNPYDKNAIRVLREDGRQVGYLPAEIAADVVAKAKKKYNFACFVEEIEEVEEEGRNVMFVQLLIVEAHPQVAPDEIKRYLKRHGLEDLIETRTNHTSHVDHTSKSGCAQVLLLTFSMTSLFMLRVFLA